KISYLARGRIALGKTDVLDEIKNSDMELENLYHDLVLKAIREDPKNAFIFTWVAFAREPLSIGALSEAISVHQIDSYTLTADKIQNKLGTLLDVIQNKVYLIHQSLRDFLGSAVLKEMQSQIGPDPQFYLADV